MHAPLVSSTSDRTDLPMPTSNRPSPPQMPLSFHHLRGRLPTIISQTNPDGEGDDLAVANSYNNTCSLTRERVLLLYNSIFDGDAGKVTKFPSQTRSEPSLIQAFICPPFEKLRAQLQNVIEGARLESQALIDMVAAPRVRRIAAHSVRSFEENVRSEVGSIPGGDPLGDDENASKRIPLLLSEHMELTQANGSNLPEVMSFLLSEHEPTRMNDGVQLRQSKRAVIAAIKVQCAWRCFMRRQKYNWVLQRQIRQLRAENTRTWLIGEVREGKNIQKK